jgi:hypothetical protein
MLEVEVEALGLFQDIQIDLVVMVVRVEVELAVLPQHPTVLSQVL